MKTAALQKELDNERANQARLGGEINQLKAQLQEAKNGLMAASRLNDQLELNQLTIEKLNNESKFLAFLSFLMNNTSHFFTILCVPYFISHLLPVKHTSFLSPSLHHSTSSSFIIHSSMHLCVLQRTKKKCDNKFFTHHHHRVFYL